MDANFDQIDFGPLKPYLEDDDVTDISYDNDGQIHLRTLSKGIFRVDNPAINNAFVEKLAFQCSNVMGKTFNMAHPFLDAESAELRLAFIHESVARNGVACVVRKTPAKIRLQKDKIVADKYVELDIVEFLEQCVAGHCNMIVSGETGSGKTELVKYLASKINENEKVITIEDTLELHLDKIFPHRDIVAMKTNNIASYTDILEACMRQNPKWILLSEVRSAEAVLAVRNSISSGHYILSTIHADKASSIPNRLYSLLETNQDLDQFMSSICRYIQLGIYVRGYTDKATHNFKREIAEVTEFFVDGNNKAGHNVIYRKGADGKVIRNNPSSYLIDYLEVQGVFLPKELLNLAGDSKADGAISVDAPLSEADISDDQTVTFNSSGATIETKTQEEETGVNPIDVVSSGTEFNDNVVSEVASSPAYENNSVFDNYQSDNLNNEDFVQNVSNNISQSELNSSLYGNLANVVNSSAVVEPASNVTMANPSAVVEPASNVTMANPNAVVEPASNEAMANPSPVVELASNEAMANPSAVVELASNEAMANPSPVVEPASNEAMANPSSVTELVSEVTSSVSDADKIDNLFG